MTLPPYEGLVLDRRYDGTARGIGDGLAVLNLPLALVLLNDGQGFDCCAVTPR